MTFTIVGSNYVRVEYNNQIWFQEMSNAEIIALRNSGADIKPRPRRTSFNRGRQDLEDRA